MTSVRHIMSVLILILWYPLAFVVLLPTALVAISNSSKADRTAFCLTKDSYFHESYAFVIIVDSLRRKKNLCYGKEQ